MQWKILIQTVPVCWIVIHVNKALFPFWILYGPSLMFVCIIQGKNLTKSILFFVHLISVEIITIKHFLNILFLLITTILFDFQLNLLSAIRHENLVPLLGYCCENDQEILVYPFMSNGSLQDRLYGTSTLSVLQHFWFFQAWPYWYLLLT